MRRETARRISDYLANRTSSSSAYLVNRLQSDRPLRGFHEWADGMPLISADRVTRADDALILLLIEWRRGGEWYVVACSPSTHGPLAELWVEEGQNEGAVLSWRYRPSKRDGRNEDRVSYFQRVVGDVALRISIPAAEDGDDRFLDDIFDLVDIRGRADDLDPNEPEPRTAFPEGAIQERRHLVRERSSALIRNVKDAARKNGRLRCEVCDFDFEARYGPIGHGYIEAHHTIPVSELSAGDQTRPEDIALVCANCHRMLHRRRPWLRKHELKAVLEAAV